MFMYEMKRAGAGLFALALVAASFVLFCLACSKPSEMDLERLKMVDETYGQKYSFKLSGEFYLEVKSRRDVQVDEEELIEIYKLFFFDSSKTRKRQTTFIYLNWYNHRGRFQYQIFYDPRKNEFKKSLQSHT